MNRYRGFTLVELLVAMVIGLLILGAVGAVYITGKRTYKARDAASRMQETGRIALRQLARGISQAGFPRDDGVAPVLVGGNPVVDLDPLGIAVSSDDPGGTISGDVVTVHRLSIPDDPVYGDRDCWGQPTRSPGHVVHSYFVEKGVLKCRGSGNPSAQPIVDGVENMQVRYGVKSGNALQYFNATALNAPDRVESIEIALLVNGGESVDAAYREQTFQLLDQTVKTPQDVAKNHPELNRLGGRGKLQRLGKMSYQIFRATIPLRNKMDF